MIKIQDIKTSNYKISFQAINNILFSLLTMYLIFFILKNPQTISSGVSCGLDICLNIIIPSLFPFMVLCNFINYSPIVTIISKLFSPFTKYLFRLPEHLGHIILISYLGGYPTGAKMISDALKNNEVDIKTASHLLSFCVNAGPSFVITAIGYISYGSKKTGIYLLISHILGSILIGAILGFMNKKKDINQVFSKTHLTYPQAFVTATSDGLFSIFNICSFVIIFSVISSIIKFILPQSTIASICLSFLELTVGINDIANLNGILSIIICSFLISFSGISVIFQIFYFMRNYEINKLHFILFRILHGLISSFISYIIFSSKNESVFTININNKPYSNLFELSPFISLIIFLLSLCFITFSFDDFFENIPSKTKIIAAKQV